MIREAEKSVSINDLQAKLNIIEARANSIRSSLTDIKNRITPKAPFDNRTVSETGKHLAARPIQYKATRKKVNTPPTNQSAQYAVRLDVRLIPEADFPYPQIKLDNPEKIFNFARSIGGLDIECLLLLHLNNELRLNCIQKILGTIDRADMHTREVIKTSILSASTNIIMVHNHPSGGLMFSGEDKATTTIIKTTASLMNIRVLDHILIAQDRYVSMKDLGEM